MALNIFPMNLYRAISKNLDKGTKELVIKLLITY